MEDRKFYVKPNWVLDADIIAEVRYEPAGSSRGDYFVGFEAGNDNPS